MADKLRCGVIGTGAIGLDHLAKLTTTHRATTVAIAENNAQRAHFAAERYHIPRSYTDYHELLEQPDIDAVTIALPNYLHAEAAIEALKARKHVLLEKPMAMNAKEAARMAEVAKKMKRTLMVAQNFRFNRHTQVAKLCIERGDLGEIFHARCFFHRRSGIPRIGSWFTQKKYAGGGCLFDIGVHVLDSCLHLIKDFDVLAVSAQTCARFGPRGLGEMDWGKSEVDPKRPFDVEDSAVAMLRLKNDKTILFETGWAGFYPTDGRDHGIDIQGTNAGLSLYPARLYRNGAGGYETVDLTAPVVPHNEDRVHHFVASVLDGKRPLVSMDESVKVQKILDAIYLSASSGKEVRLK